MHRQYFMDAPQSIGVRRRRRLVHLMLDIVFIPWTSSSNVLAGGLTSALGSRAFEMTLSVWLGGVALSVLMNAFWAS